MPIPRTTARTARLVAGRLALLLGSAVPLAAQVEPLPGGSTGPAALAVTASAALFDLDAFEGGSDGGIWRYSGGMQFRGGIERSLRRDVAVGVAGSYARLPLRVQGGLCSGCAGEATVWQALATARLGGSRGIGFHSVLEGTAGVTGFTAFERGSDPSSAPGFTSGNSVAPTFGVSYGVGYTVQPRVDVSLVQEIGVMRYDPGASGTSSTPRFRSTRFTVRYALARPR